MSYAVHIHPARALMETQAERAAMKAQRGLGAAEDTGAAFTGGPSIQGHDASSSSAGTGCES